MVCDQFTGTKVLSDHFCVIGDSSGNISDSIPFVESPLMSVYRKEVLSLCSSIEVRLCHCQSLSNMMAGGLFLDIQKSALVSTPFTTKLRSCMISINSPLYSPASVKIMVWLLSMDIPGIYFHISSYIRLTSLSESKTAKNV